MGDEGDVCGDDDEGFTCVLPTGHGGVHEYGSSGGGAWIVECDRHGGFLERPGALVFSPPLWGRKVEKYHVCMECWADLIVWLRGGL